MSNQVHFENHQVSQGAARRAGLSLFIFTFFFLFCVAKNAVAAAAPVITSSTMASVRLGSTIAYQIAATNTPTSHRAASSLPTATTRVTTIATKVPRSTNSSLMSLHTLRLMSTSISRHVLDPLSHVSLGSSPLQPRQRRSWMGQVLLH